MFTQAIPIWLKGLEQERNVLAGFRAVFPGATDHPLTLRLAGATLYRVSLNGIFVHHGPARGPHGFYRVDEMDLTNLVRPGVANVLAIEVAAYASCSYAYLNQPAFLQAELEQSGAILAATGDSSFAGRRLPERIQKVDRFSFQRPCAEAYRKNPDSDRWKFDSAAAFLNEPCVTLPARLLLPRRVAIPDYEVLPSLKCLRVGRVTPPPPDHPHHALLQPEIYTMMGSFLPEEFELDLLGTYEACACTDAPPLPGDGSFALHDFGRNLTGFIQLQVRCTAPARLLACFDEVLVEGEIRRERSQTLALLYFELQPGTYALEAIEPNTFRYLKLIHPDGGLEVESVALREFANPEAARAAFTCSDPDLELIFESGRQTFRQNAVDIYMDCPGRERAGWLCDSYFTGQTEPLLCGGSTVETNFLENFALPARFPDLPEGMLPMCYPSEHPNGQFIPQWALWLILELEDYQDRTGNTDMAAALRAKVHGLLAYLKQFENTDGLLEKLPSWNFIEWSHANRLMQDVNYPTNMLYARALEAAAGLYGNAGWSTQAKAIHATVRAQSLQGSFFVDNAVRDDAGVLQLSGQSSEACQYYAFFCGTARPETDEALWSILLEHFGPQAQAPAAYPSIHPANAFIGYFLRMTLLSRYGEPARLLAEMKGYFLRMAQKTGTLWEHNDTRASCNHGFASQLCALLYREALGVRSIDRALRMVVLQPPAPSLDHCAGEIPVLDGVLRLSWKRRVDGVEWSTDLPPGWTVEHSPQSR